MAIVNLDARNAHATLDTDANVVTLQHDSPKRNGGEPLEIPVGALRSVEWVRMPDPQKPRMTGLRLRFYYKVPGLPSQMQVGVMQAMTSRMNVRFVEELQDAIAQSAPDREWEYPVDKALWDKFKRRNGALQIVAAIVCVALVAAAVFVGVRHIRDESASQQAEAAVMQMSDEEKVPLFNNYLVSVGIKGKPASQMQMAKTVCRHFARGDSLDQVGMAMLLTKNGMTANQKGKFIRASVYWWCPSFKTLLPQ